MGAGGVLKLVLPIQIVQNFNGRVLHICASVSSKHRNDIIADIQSLYPSDQSSTSISIAPMQLLEAGGRGGMLQDFITLYI